MLMTFNNTARADTSARGSDNIAMGTIPTNWSVVPCDPLDARAANSDYNQEMKAHLRRSLELLELSLLMN